MYSFTGKTEMKKSRNTYLLPVICATAANAVAQLRITAQVNGANATIEIVDYIGDYENTGGSMRKVVDDLLAQGVRSANVYLNSQGGSVFDASEIANQLGRIPKVSVRVGALAASAATYITSKFYTVAAKNSQFMIHKPMLYASGNESEIQSQLKLLQNLTADYKAAYAAKTGMTEEQIEALWAAGDYWMSATEALAKKFIDEMVVDEVEIDDLSIALLRASSAPVIPQKTVINNSNNKMKKEQLIAMLGLSADATEEQIAARLTELKSKEAQLSAYEALAIQKAKALVDKAIQDKRITESERESYEAFAKANYDACAKLIGGTPVLPKPTAGMSRTPRTESSDARANWTLDDYLEKDPQALNELAEKEPEKFKALNDAFYGGK